MKLIAETKSMNDVLILQSKTPFVLEDGLYDVEIKPISKKRTNRQNSYFWALLGEISKKENGDLKDVETLYVRLLMMSGAKYEVIYAQHDALESLRDFDVVRHVQIVKQEVVKNKVYDTAYVFYGSSKMSTKEFGDLLDTTLNYAAEMGIYTPYWEELLKQ